MGISTHYYTVYGVKINEYDDNFYEAYDDLYDEIEKDENLDIILDGMSGEYMIFGKILYSSGDLRYSEYGDSHTDIELSLLPEYKERCVERFKHYFYTSDFNHYLDQEWKLMTFVHYS